jgi:hypothetical protein
LKEKKEKPTCTTSTSSTVQQQKQETQPTITAQPRPHTATKQAVMAQEHQKSGCTKNRNNKKKRDHLTAK